MYDIQIRNSVLRLFNGVDVEKLPDESFKLIKDEPGYDQIFTRQLSANSLAFNLFNIVEKHIHPNPVCIKRVILSCSEIQNVDTSSLKVLINKLVELLGKDDSTLGEFTEKDDDQFKTGYWSGRTWQTLNTKGVALTIQKNSDVFELHLIFMK